MGFPAPNKTFFTPNDSRLTIDFLNGGTERVMLPVIRRPIAKPSLRLYQSIIKYEGNDEMPQFNNAYFAKHFNEKKSKIFVENDFTGEVGFVDESCIIGNVASLSRNTLQSRLAIQTLDFQIFALEQLCPSTDRLDKKEQFERRKFYRENIQFNKTYIQKIKTTPLSVLFGSTKG